MSKNSKTAQNDNRAKRVKRRLLNAAGKPPELLLALYDNSYSGYDEEKVADMREMYGSNEITNQKSDSMIVKFIESFINPFTVVLMVLAAVSAFTGDAATVLIISVLVILSGVLQFVQEFRSSEAARRLSEMVETTITVQRQITDEDSETIESHKMEIPLSELVVGDVIFLAAGDMIPADVRIIQSKDLFVSESSLTGESEPVEKFSDAVEGKRTNPIELNNLAFMGSNVVSGSSVAVVIAVGDDTVFGSISKQLQNKKSETSFEKGINSTSWILIRFMAIVLPIVFFINGFNKGSWTEAFLFAISVAVGLAPEMLPMIVATNLAKGAVSMSREKVIVKNLNSIQNFGAMDVLCTDKTGTITQDKIILEYHLDIHGNQDSRVLKHAFLNSYHQTGLKNLMDIAIIERSHDDEMVNLWKNYKKVDEIPFDFNRRRMSVVVSDENNKTQLITKGAIEEMLSISDFAEYEGKIEPITEKIRSEILSTCRRYNADGMRVLGIAQKNNPSPVGSFSVDDESHMVLIGYLAFLDPPKESSAKAIKALHGYGVDVKVLTGDNDAVAKCVCKQVGIKTDKIILGSEIEEMSENELKSAVETANIFAKLSPQQKEKIVNALRGNNHTVGFMGDGINDATAMKASDVGISVDTAVDIAKESASIILLEKDLTVLEQGVIEGRKTYANIIKYIKMTASSNFGNIFSILAASAFLPFLPMLPIQILVLNLIYDTMCISIPWDNVDTEYLRKPRKWNSDSITKFMLWFGPASSVFDIVTYIVLFFVICPEVAGGGFLDSDSTSKSVFAMVFHTGWFIESLWSQTVVVHLVRTKKLSFIHSNASVQVVLLTALGIIAGTVIPYTPIGKHLDMYPIPHLYFPAILAIIAAYVIFISVTKKIFVKKYGDLL